jgi:hypothetical protein
MGSRSKVEPPRKRTSAINHSEKALPIVLVKAPGLAHVKGSEALQRAPQILGRLHLLAERSVNLLNPDF